MSEIEIKIGDKVRITKNHWLRPNECGVVVDMAKDKIGLRYCVEFPSKWDGGGIEGCKLWLHDDCFSKV